MSRPAISFRRSTSAGAMLAVGVGLRMQHAVDAEADLQLVFLRLDVDVGGVHLHRVLEHRSAAA